MLTMSKAQAVQNVEEIYSFVERTGRDLPFIFKDQHGSVLALCYYTSRGNIRFSAFAKQYDAKQFANKLAKIGCPCYGIVSKIKYK